MFTNIWYNFAFLWQRCRRLNFSGFTERSHLGTYQSIVRMNPHSLLSRVASLILLIIWSIVTYIEPCDELKYRKYCVSFPLVRSSLIHRTRWMQHVGLSIRGLCHFSRFIFSSSRSSFFSCWWTWWVIILFINLTYYPLRSHFSPSWGESKTYPSCQLSPDNKRKLHGCTKVWWKSNFIHHHATLCNRVVKRNNIARCALNVASVWPGLENPRTIWPLCVAFAHKHGALILVRGLSGVRFGL